MKEKILRKLFLGFIQIHILFHANKEPIYGIWIMNELEKHGYKVSPGTIYPLLNNMEKKGILSRTDKNVDGRILKFYEITNLGKEILSEATEKASELIYEINEKDESNLNI